MLFGDDVLVVVVQPDAAFSMMREIRVLSAVLKSALNIGGDSGHEKEKEESPKQPEAFISIMYVCRFIGRTNVSRSDVWGFEECLHVSSFVPAGREGLGLFFRIINSFDRFFSQLLHGVWCRISRGLV